MRTLIFADTHLTRRFDPAKFNLLKRLITSADRVIIAGDFWDSWFTDFSGFVNSRWRQLFPLLLARRTIYIYGNHDPKHLSDQRTRLFSVKSADHIDIRSGNRIFHLEHGHRLLHGQTSGFMHQYGKLLQAADVFPVFGFLLHYFLHLLEFLGFKLLGVKFMTGSLAGHRHNRILKRLNNFQFLICGDTHGPDLDEINRFANPGPILYGHASYLLIEDGLISLHHTAY